MRRWLVVCRALGLVLSASARIEWVLSEFYLWGEEVRWKIERKYCDHVDWPL